MLHRLSLSGACCLAAGWILLPHPLSAADSRTDGPTRENRLAREKSPYLQQHAHNPVDWYPWSDEAFERASRENKPVFLSIGYSTCHWCHVMEHESFADEETARFLNQHFICVKVDREERPDVDRIYMSFQQRVYGHGGWPLSVWLTPERIPFASGTYFPPQPRDGMPSFTGVCRQILSHWEENGEKIRADPEGTRKQLEEILTYLGEPDASSGNDKDPQASVAQLAYRGLARSFIPNPAGFTDEPRFPRTDILDFLLQYHLDTSHPLPERTEALAMARATLEAMARGGIRDHLGGGFHRYSVDRHWHVPHFEKMLYDQAQVARCYLTLHQVTGEPSHAEIARQTLAYMVHDLGHPEGPFYSAEDADSFAKPGDSRKAEGAFYVWTAGEIAKILGPGESAVFNRAYGVLPAGNVEARSDPHGELQGRNQLHLATTAGELAASLDSSAQQLVTRLASARGQLLEARSRRPRPLRDDKIITAWNALAISALAHAYRALGDEAYLERAKRAAAFLTTRLRGARGQLLRSYLDGPSGIPATAIDYAACIAALIDLYEADFDPAHLHEAIALQETMLELLHDPEAGGFYDSPKGQVDLIVRMKDLEDGALPSANSLAALNLMRLHLLTGREDFRLAARGIFALAGPLLTAAPQAVLRLVGALQLDLDPPPQILLAVPRIETPGARKLLLPAQRSPRSDRIIALLAPGTLPGKLANYQPIDGLATLYLCRDFTCLAPSSDPKAISRLIREALELRDQRAE